MTAEILIGKLWRMCLMSAREAGHDARRSACNGLSSRHGRFWHITAARNSLPIPCCLMLYTAIHWDGDRPTDRIFEALLEMELAEFFS